jgi:hypothetical protein
MGFTITDLLDESSLENFPANAYYSKVNSNISAKKNLKIHFYTLYIHGIRLIQKKYPPGRTPVLSPFGKEPDSLVRSGLPGNINSIQLLYNKFRGE